jgi:hypothetical protein
MNAHGLSAAMLCALVASTTGLDAREGTAFRRQSPSGFQVAQATAPSIATLLPNAGPFGTWVIIRGAGFTATNTIEFRGAVDVFDIAPIRSNDGVTLQFQVTTCPQQEVQCPSRYISPGAYAVTVANANGRSNQAKFLLTSRSGRLTTGFVR